MNNNRIPAESHAIQYTLLPVPVDFPFNSFSFSFLRREIALPSIARKIVSDFFIPFLNEIEF